MKPEIIGLEIDEIFQQGKNEQKSLAVENHEMLLNKFMSYIMCRFENKQGHTWHSFDWSHTRVLHRLYREYNHVNGKNVSFLTYKKTVSNPNHMQSCVSLEVSGY